MPDRLNDILNQNYAFVWFFVCWMLFILVLIFMCLFCFCWWHFRRFLTFNFFCISYSCMSFKHLYIFNHMFLFVFYQFLSFLPWLLFDFFFWGRGEEVTYALVFKNSYPVAFVHSNLLLCLHTLYQWYASYIKNFLFIVLLCNVLTNYIQTRIDKIHKLNENGLIQMNNNLARITRLSNGNSTLVY